MKQLLSLVVASIMLIACQSCTSLSGSTEELGEDLRLTEKTKASNRSALSDTNSSKHQNLIGTRAGQTKNGTIDWSRSAKGTIGDEHFVSKLERYLGVEFDHDLFKLSKKIAGKFYGVSRYVSAFGVRVKAVQKGGIAEKAGVKSGALFTRANFEKVNRPNVVQYIAAGDLHSTNMNLKFLNPDQFNVHSMIMREMNVYVAPNVIKNMVPSTGTPTVSGNSLLAADGHRIFAIRDSGFKSGYDRMKYFREKAVRGIGLSRYCTEKTPARWCEIRLIGNNDKIVEKYVALPYGGLGGLTFQRGEPWRDNALWSKTFPHLHSLAQKDFETLTLVPYYKEVVQEIIFWFGIKYGQYCKGQLDNPIRIAGTIQNKRVYSGTVVGKVDFDYTVERALYHLAREYHDSTVDYRVIGAFARQTSISGMNDFFDSYKCNSPHVQNVRESLSFLARNWDRLGNDVAVTNGRNFRAWR